MKRNVILALVGLLAVAWLSAINDMVSVPKNLKQHVEKAEAFEKKEIYVDAVTEYQGALEYKQGDVELSMKMANDYLAYGDTKKFIATCQQLAETDQKNTTALDTLMKYYQDNMQEDRAVKYLKTFTEKYPDNENAAKWLKELQGTYTTIFCKYSQMSPVYNDSMVVKNEMAYGITDATGKDLTECIYSEVHPYSADGYALVLRENGTYAYLDRDGLARKAPDEGYTDLGQFNENRAPACKDGKYGFLDENMEEKTDFSWDALTSVKNRLAAAQQNGKWAIVSLNGKAKTEYIYDDVICDENGICSEQKLFIVKENDSYHLVNSKGKRVGEETFEAAKAFTKAGYAAVCKNGKWGFVNEKGELVIDYQYEDALSFSNGYAAVKKDGKWGYIDTENTMAVDPELALATSLSDEGTAAVKIVNEDGEEWQLIQLCIFE